MTASTRQTSNRLGMEAESLSPRPPNLAPSSTFLYGVETGDYYVEMNSRTLAQLPVGDALHEAVGRAAVPRSLAGTC